MRASLLVLVACSRPAIPVPAVHIDERVETLAILERLAGSREDNQVEPNQISSSVSCANTPHSGYSISDQIRASR